MREVSRAEIVAAVAKLLDGIPLLIVESDVATPALQAALAPLQGLARRAVRDVERREDRAAVLAAMAMGLLGLARDGISPRVGGDEVAGLVMWRYLTMVLLDMDQVNGADHASDRGEG
jgi:hypothetical protein